MRANPPPPRRIASGVPASKCCRSQPKVRHCRARPGHSEVPCPRWVEPRSVRHSMPI